VIGDRLGLARQRLRRLLARCCSSKFEVALHTSDVSQSEGKLQRSWSVSDHVGARQLSVSRPI